MVYLICIVLYLGILSAIGIRASFRVKDSEDFSVAGRTLSPWVMVMTMLACWIGTGSIVGNAGKTFETGLAAVFLPGGAVIGMILLSFIARRARKIEANSVPEIIGRRFGPVARGLSVIALIIAYLVIVSYQFNAGAGVILAISEGLVSEQTTHWLEDWATLIAAICIISFAMLAGLMSLAYQDVLTGIIISVTVVVSCGLYWFQAGGWEGIESSYEGRAGFENHMQVFGVYSGFDLVNFLLPSLLLVLGDANQYQRIFGSRNAKGASSAVSALIFVSLTIELVIILTAWIASSMITDAEEGKYVLIYAARDFLPLPLGCLFMVTVVGIIVSTANSFLLVPATTFVTDVWERRSKDSAKSKPSKGSLLVSRLMVLVFGAIAYGVSLMFSSSTTVFEKALYAFTIYGASITPSLVAALVWKRATSAGAVSSILSGAVVSLLWSEQNNLLSRIPRSVLDPDRLPAWRNDLDAVLPAIMASVLCLVFVSLLTKPKPVQPEGNPAT